METEFLQSKSVLADVYFTKCFKNHTFYTVWFIGGACFHGFLADGDKFEFIPIPKNWRSSHGLWSYSNYHHVKTQLEHERLHCDLVYKIRNDATFCPSRLRKSMVY